MTDLCLSPTDEQAKTHCHDNFGYYVCKLLISGGYMNGGSGRRYAVKGILVDS